MTSPDILSKAPPPPHARLHYGTESNQFGDVRLPSGKGAYPVLTFIHGGFWRAKYDLLHAGHLCAALAKAGIATWNLEYRRVGNPGGGWPGTFADVLSGYRYLTELAAKYKLDLARSVVMGHSAGGHLALCLAAHQRPSRGVVSLAGVVDLQRAWELHLSHDAVVDFLGGTPRDAPQRYRDASPAEIAVAGAQRLIHGTLDVTVPVEMSREYSKRKQARREDVHLLELPSAGHFDLIDPASPSWSRVEQTVMSLIG